MHHQQVWRGRLRAAAVGAIGASLFGAGPPGAPEQRATPRLVVEQGFVPGETAMLGVTFAIEKGWHLYWRNPGDSGLPPNIRLTLPDGLEAGEPIWPTPKRYLQPGDILDYIYENEVTVAFPVQVAETLTPAQTVRIEAQIDWLVCKEVCIPGEARIAGTFSVQSEARPGPDAARFQRARARWAKPMKDLPKGRVEAAWRGDRLTLAAPGATSLTFFPYESAAFVYPEDLPRTGHRQGSRMELVYPEKAAEGPRIRGVLEIRRAKGAAPEFVLIDMPPPDGPGA